MRKTLKKSLAVLAAASVCSSMLLNFPSGTFQIRWSASAEEPAGTIEGIAIDETNFPDANFRTYVQENFDTTADGILSESERKQATKIQVSNKNISDLTGISYFTELTDLNCDSDNLTALDLSKNTELITLVCPSNNLTALDLSKNTKLTDLYCNSNDLTVLNVRNNTELTILACSSNDLTELDVSQNTKLTSLYCKSNDLTALDVRNNTELTILECFSNDLTELDVSQNKKLTFLYCDSNNLTTLDISQNTGLTHLSCSDNMYVIVVTDHSFDLSTLPGNFDINKASDWTNATIDGNTLTVTDLKADVTYTYNLGNEKTATFTLHPVSCILTESMAEAIPIQSYTGSAITPDVTLQYDDTILQKDTDYTVSYTNNTEIGTAKAIITGIGSFAGKIEIPFEIGVAINETNFPDEVFRRDLKWKFPEMQGDILSQSELEKVTEMGCRVGTLDLTGIAFFKNLKELHCHNCDLTQLDVSQNLALEILECGDNKLTTLDVSQNKELKRLNCESNRLTELDVSQNAKLEDLTCMDNNLTELDISQNTKLESLNCSDNELTELDLSQNTALKSLRCGANPFGKLDLTQNTELTGLECFQNELTELDLHQNKVLESIDCSGNSITTISFDQSPNLKWINCNNNNLTELDLSQNQVARNVFCNNNQLTVLDLSQNTTLETLECESNQLTSLNFDNNPKLYALHYENNSYAITLKDSTFDLSTLPGDFDPSRASDWSNATIENKQLTVIDPMEDVTYSYDAGMGKTATFTLHPTDHQLTESMVEAIPDQLYTGSELQPTVTLQFGNHVLEKDKDYTVSYANNTRTGFAEAVITGIGEFTGTITIPFGIGVAINETHFPDEIFRTYVKEQFDLTEDDILTASELQKVTQIDVSNKDISDLSGVEFFFALQSLSCDNNKLTELDTSQNPELLILHCYENNLTTLDTSQNSKLEELICNNNHLISLRVNQSAALQTLFCYSNYLTALDLSKCTKLINLNCDANIYTFDLNGTTFDLSTLPEGFEVQKVLEWKNATVDDNLLTVSNPMEDVTYTYNLGGNRIARFTLRPVSCKLTKSMIAAIPNQIYTGSELEPNLTIQFDDYTLSPDTDYTVSYANNVTAGVATAIVVGKGFFEGKIIVPFTISPADLMNAEVELENDPFIYNGTLQKASIKRVTINGITLTEKDYTVSGNTATKSGTYTLTVQGKGNFTGKATAEWSIAKATPSVTPVIPDQKYTAGDSLPELGYKCSVDGVITWITNLEKGLIGGENELEWRFTPDDTDNYEAITGTVLIVVETTTTTTTATTTTPTTTTTTNTTTTTAKPVTSTTTKTNATTTSTNPTTTSTTKAIATTTATKPITTSTTKAAGTTTETKPTTTIQTTTSTNGTTTKATQTTTTTAQTTTRINTTTISIQATTTASTATNATTTTMQSTTATTPTAKTTTTTIESTTTATTTITKSTTTSTSKTVVTTTKPVTTSTTKAIATTTVTKPITATTTKAVVTTTIITTTTKSVTTIQTTASTNGTTTTTAQTTTRTNTTTTTTQATTTSTTTNATTITMQSTTATTSTAKTTSTTMKPAITTTTSTASTTTTTVTTTTTTATTTTTLLTTTSSVVPTTTTPVVTTVITTTTGATSIVVVPKEANFYFAEDTTTFTPGDLFESITLIQEDGTEVDITDQITLPEVSPSTVETDEQHRAILPVFYQDELLAELTVPVYIGKKGDIDLDGDVTLADATLALTYYSEHAVNNDFYFTTQSAQAPQTEAEQMLEKLMFFLADIDTESKQGADTDNGMIELLDATRILTYYAEQAVGNLPSWSN